MSTEALAFVKNLFAQLDIPYAFMRWDKADLPECYFVGQYNEVPGVVKEETGLQESTFILRGYTRGAWLLLEQAKANIERNIPQTAILPNGNGIAVLYRDGLVVPTGDADLKSIQISLNIKEWKVN